MATRTTFTPRPKFKPVLKRARVGTPGFSADEMLKFANTLNNSIGLRMDHGLDVYDQAAPPLAARYRKYKERKVGSGIRDMRLTGRTRRGMRALSAEQNKAVIGFSDPEAARRIKINALRSRQYGASPRDLEVLQREVQESRERPVVVETMAS